MKEALVVLKKQIAKAHCSVAELYMTDLCYDEGAESLCERSIEAALRVEATSLDAQQTLASLRLSQDRQLDASAIMTQVYQRVIAIRDAVSERTVMEEIAGAPDKVDMAGDSHSLLLLLNPLFLLFLLICRE